MAGLVRHPDDLVSAVQCASISVRLSLPPSACSPLSEQAADGLSHSQASFTIEQFGLPHLSLADDGTELWNGVDPAVRLDEMRRRQGQEQERVGVDEAH